MKGTKIVTEESRRKAKAHWDSLTPEQKCVEWKKWQLDNGLKECPFCGMIPEVKYNLNGDWWMYPLICNFEEIPTDEALAANRMPRCRNHNEEATAKIRVMRFSSFKELRGFWNNLIKETIATDT